MNGLLEDVAASEAERVNADYASYREILQRSVAGTTTDDDHLLLLKLLSDLGMSRDDAGRDLTVLRRACNAQAVIDKGTPKLDELHEALKKQMADVDAAEKLLLEAKARCNSVALERQGLSSRVLGSSEELRNLQRVHWRLLGLEQPAEAAAASDGPTVIVDVAETTRQLDAMDREERRRHPTRYILGEAIDVHPDRVDRRSESIKSVNEPGERAGSAVATLNEP